jgi:hypothetical protein
MDDFDFLEQCGIEPDPKWMSQVTERDPLINLEALIEENSLPEDACNYAKSLVRLTNMLGQSRR